jgi:hypothetical protein
MDNISNHNNGTQAAVSVMLPLEVTPGLAQHAEPEVILLQTPAACPALSTAGAVAAAQASQQPRVEALTSKADGEAAFLEGDDIGDFVEWGS